MTWDRRLYFPSEGRRAEDFFALKIRRLRPGLNPRTWALKANTLPLDHRSRCLWYILYFFLWTLCWGGFELWHLLFPLHFLSQTFVLNYFLECTQFFGCSDGFCCVAFWLKIKIQVFCYVIPCQVADRVEELEMKSEVCHRVSCRAMLSSQIPLQAVLSLLCDNRN